MSTTQNVSQDGLKKLIDALFIETSSKVKSLFDESIQRSAAIFEESREFALKRSSEIISSYTEMAAIESRKSVSKAEIDIRMNTLKLKESYIEKVFEETRKRLNEYASSSEYKSMLLKDLTAVSKKFDAGEILMTDRDISAIGEAKLKKAVGSDVTFKAERVNIGGFIMMSKDGKSSIDRTVDGDLSAMKEKLRGKIAEQLFG